MLDTLMALWNQGAHGRGIMVATAFFIICISISLLLVPVEGSWTSWLSGQGNSPADQSRIISSTDPTATARSNAIGPTADHTTTIYTPTATPIARATAGANPCTTSIAHTAPLTPASTLPRRKGTPVRSTPVVTPTPAHTPTPVVTPTNTPLPSPTATETPSPVVTPTQTPAVSPTPTQTATPVVTPTQTATASPTPTQTPLPDPTPTITRTPAGTSTGIPTFRPAKQGNVAGAVRLRGTGQRTDAWYTNCLQSRAGDSIDMYTNAQVIAILGHNLGFILGGSTLGTLFFYGMLYLLLRKKKV